MSPDPIVTTMLAIILSLLGFGVSLLMLSFLGYIAFHWYIYRDREKRSLNSVLLQIALPRDNEIKIDAAEQMFASFFSLRKQYATFMTLQPHISFEIVGQPGDIRSYVHTPIKYPALLQKQINST